MSGRILYNTLICTLGSILLGILIYGLSLADDTVSNTMISSTHYRIIISVCILLQISVWITCRYSKRRTDPDTAAWGLLSLGITAASWVGLTNILSGTPHIIFVIIFTTSFMVDLLILCNLTWQRRAVDILLLSIAFLLICMIAMIILYNTNKFFIMEHVGMIAYSLIFTVFFLAHPPEEWEGGEYLDCNEYV